MLWIVFILYEHVINHSIFHKNLITAFHYDIAKEIYHLNKVVLPIAALSGIIIYLLRDFLIKVLFTNAFAPMQELFAWQMLGDTLKIGSWILGYVLTAKALVGLYIFSEFIFSCLFFFLVWYLTSLMGIKGVAVAHALNYLLHFLFMFSVLKWKGIVKWEHFLKK